MKIYQYERDYKMLYSKAIYKAVLLKAIVDGKNLYSFCQV